MYVNKLVNELRNRRNNVNDRLNNNTPEFDTRKCITLLYVKGVGENVNYFINKLGLNTVFTVFKKLDLIKKGKDIKSAHL